MSEVAAAPISVETPAVAASVAPVSPAASAGSKKAKEATKPAAKAAKPKAQAATKPKAVAAKTSNSDAPSHPKYLDMVLEGVKELKERTGSSKQALVKFVGSKYGIDEKTCNQHVKNALRAGVKSGALKQVSGLGASGSFKLGEVAKTAKAKTATAVPKDKPAVAKPAASKPAAAKPKIKVALKAASPAKKATPAKKASPKK